MNEKTFVCCGCRAIVADAYPERCYIGEKYFCRPCAYAIQIADLENGKPIWMTAFFAISVTLEESLLAACDSTYRQKLVSKKSEERRDERGYWRPWDATMGGKWYVYASNCTFRFYAHVKYGRHNMAGRYGRMDIWFQCHKGFEGYGRCCRSSANALFRRTKTFLRKNKRSAPSMLRSDYDTSIELSI